MTKKPESIFHTFKQITLDDHARASMRETLAAYADMHPVIAKPVRAPFISIRFIGAFATLVLVITAGTGVSYGAERAVPGDLLYAVKRKVNEPIAGSLATDTESKAKHHATLAERRLEEAAKLAIADKLDAQKSAALTEEFEAAAEASVSFAQELESEGNTTVALEVRSDLEARLSAHSQILAAVSSLQEESDPAREVARQASQQASKVAMIREETEAELIGTTVVEVEVEEEPAIASAPAEDTAVMLMAAKIAEEPDVVEEQQKDIQVQTIEVPAENPEARAFIKIQEETRIKKEAEILEKFQNMLEKAGVDVKEPIHEDLIPDL